MDERKCNKPIGMGAFIAILENVDRMSEPELREVEKRIVIRRALLESDRHCCNCRCFTDRKDTKNED